MARRATEDEQAVERLVDRYCDAVNRRDWAAYRSCWADDGVWDLGEPINTRREGIEAIMEEVTGTVEGLDFYVQIAQGGVVSVEGDEATARWTVHEMGRPREGVEFPFPGMFIWAFYSDDLARGADGEWRFKQRHYDVVYFDTGELKGDAYELPQSLRDTTALPR